jgi:hypothetical protein
LQAKLSDNTPTVMPAPLTLNWVRARLARRLTSPCDTAFLGSASVEASGARAYLSAGSTASLPSALTGTRADTNGPRVRTLVAPRAFNEAASAAPLVATASSPTVARVTRSALLALRKFLSATPLALASWYSW